jgi:phosphohistidine phosphatase
LDRVILLRHGKAENSSATGGDFDRALTERGKADAALIAHALAQSGFVPDVALVSPAVRAMQTWAAAAPAFPETLLQVAPALYNAGPGEILGLLEGRGQGARTVLVVGHNPGLHQLSVRLARSAAAPAQMLARLDQGLPTAAASVTDFDPPAFHLFTPKALGGGA